MVRGSGEAGMLSVLLSPSRQKKTKLCPIPDFWCDSSIAAGRQRRTSAIGWDMAWLGEPHFQTHGSSGDLAPANPRKAGPI
jgi:hypothetical protein